MTNEVTTYLKYANLQIAAEALFEFNHLRPTGSAGPGSTASYPTINPVYLTDGNNRSSKLTSTQAQQFINDGWTVVEHISNTTTGFSGTLFRALRDDEARGIKAGEQVLSFRSTEFADDARATTFYWAASSCMSPSAGTSSAQPARSPSRSGYRAIPPTTAATRRGGSSGWTTKATPSCCARSSRAQRPGTAWCRTTMRPPASA